MIITRYKKPTQTYTPYRGLDLFNEFINRFEQSTQQNTNLTDFHPNVNTREDEDKYYIEVDLPGIKKDNVDINVEDNVLTISGNRELKNETKEENYYKVESSYGSFSRSFTLPEKVDIENIQAKTTDGVLEVEIPKIKVITEKVKKIEIK
jgi:HSP20 family protein